MEKLFIIILTVVALAGLLPIHFLWMRDKISWNQRQILTAILCGIIAIAAITFGTIFF